MIPHMTCEEEMKLKEAQGQESDFEKAVNDMSRVPGTILFFTRTRLAGSAAAAYFAQNRDTFIAFNPGELLALLGGKSGRIIVCPGVRSFLTGWRLPEGTAVVHHCTAILAPDEKAQFEARFLRADHDL